MSYRGRRKGHDADKKLLKYLYDHHHTSPFEQVELTVSIKAPEFVFGHFVRHRTANINALSYRYKEAEEDDFYIPDKWRLQAKQNKQCSFGNVEAHNLMHMLRLRLDSSAQYETRLYAEAIRKIFADKFPLIAEIGGFDKEVEIL